MRPQALNCGAPAWFYWGAAAFVVADVVLFGLTVAGIARWVL